MPLKNLENLFERSFNRQLKQEKNRIIRRGRRLVREADEQLEQALDSDDLGDNQVLSDTLGDLQAKAQANKEQELKLQKLINRHNEETNEIVMGWVAEVESFVSFLNDPTNETSIKSIIDGAVSGSVLETIKTKESGTLTRVAQAASSLAQSLRSYVTGKAATAQPAQPEQPVE